MSDQWLDALARQVASDLPRRRAVRLLGGGLAATIFGGLLPGEAFAAGRRGKAAPQRPDRPESGAAADGATLKCLEFCVQSFPKGQQRDQCLKDSLQKTGICYQCGPASTSGEILCNGVCVDPSSDNNNCGACGNVCSNGSTCERGTCVTNTCQNVQNGCVNNGNCNGNGNCFCYNTADGVSACAQNTSCSVQQCTSNDQCPSGTVCIVDTCCPTGICAPLCGGTALAAETPGQGGLMSTMH